MTVDEDDHHLAQEGHEHTLLHGQCAAEQDVEDWWHLKEEGEKE